MLEIKVKAAIRYMVLLLGSVASGAITWWYVTHVNPGATTEDTLKVLAVCVGLLTLIYTAINSQFSYDVHLLEALNEKKRTSLDLITEWQSSDMAKITVIGKKIREKIKMLDGKAAMALIRADKSDQEAFVALLNFFEKLSIAIEHDLVDQAVLKDFFVPILPIYYSATRDVIQELRREFQSELVFTHFESVGKKWQDHKTAA